MGGELRECGKLKDVVADRESLEAVLVGEMSRRWTKPNWSCNGPSRALACNTFREAVRDRVLYSILFFAIGVIVLSLALQEITVGDREKVVRSVALGSIAAFGAIISMFLGISLVWKEVERKTVYTILSKPISRWMFVLGKYLGMMMTLVVQIAVMLVVYTILLTAQQTFPPMVVYVSALLLIVELMLLTSWATLFSTYSAPTTAAAFTLAIFLIGHLADDIWLYGSALRVPGGPDRQDAQVLPNFEMFNIRSHAVHELPIPWEQVTGAVAYGAFYTAAVLGLAMVVFERRDRKWLCRGSVVDQVCSSIDEFDRAGAALGPVGGR